jgi:hypothetical protein
MKKLFFVLMMSVFSVAHAADSNVEAEVTAAMQRNFEACNREDIRAVMDSCALEMPDRDKFEKETISVFEEKDIHYSLLECELLEVKHPYALARIVQDTLVKDRFSKDKKQKKTWLLFSIFGLLW